ARSSKSRFNRALTDLQRGLWILPIGIAEAGSWRYAFIYELFDRWFPDVSEQARGFSLRQARAELVKNYLLSLGVSESREIAKLFRWETENSIQALEDLETAGDALHLSDDRWAIKDIIRGK
ncbi:MAG: winged helix DNA-binding domain-containing protein, partial [Anaerolineales bacterium]|nr:winged helix DNA-binding domain-containing protein [Anaerolineales bacterium]